METAPSGLGKTWATIVSYVINPLILIPIGFAVILMHFQAPPAEIWRLTIVATVCFFLAPICYIYILIRRGKVKNVDVPNRENRTGPMMASAVSYAMGAGLVALLAEAPASQLLVAISALGLLNTFLLLAITLRWKISLHVAGLAGMLGFLGFITWTDWPWPIEPLLTSGTLAPFFGLIPLVAWARIRLRIHTLAQTLAGALFGLLLPPLELYLCTQLFLDLSL